ncbi:envelope protein F13 [BeAn 58058 virus]|uniref:envelope protein F13 n=1 Tax=BeAn 58058 virus TaxID=67082 RepID=UPI00090BFD6A|nr:envelope protein F13 [BeAn 58058 virus]APG58234.1 envelope protein F13 [BeAn 58058 virus]
MWSLFSKVPNGAGCRIVETIPLNSELRSQHMLTHECFNEIIQSAKKNINIVSFCCNLKTSEYGKNIMNNLINVVKKGIKVTIMVDYQSSNRDEEDLKRAGIQYIKMKLCNDKPGVVLGSFWVSDNTRCYIGNASLTGGSVATIKTLGMYSEYPPLAYDLQRRFDTFKTFDKDKRWYNMCSYGVCMPLSTKYHINNPIGGVFFSDSPDRILGCSRTLDADVVLSKIMNAKFTIDIELLSLVPVVREDDKVTFWPDIYNEIISAVINRGVKVRLLIGSWDKNDIYSMSSIKGLKMMCSNNDLVVKLFHEKNNTKLMIVDNNFAHITSANFDGTHYLHHAFVSFNTIDSYLVKELTSVFNRDWDNEKNIFMI